MEKALSLRLHDVMNSIGASENTRRLHQQCTITEEILKTINFQMNSVHGVDCSAFILGSQCEGTTTPDLLSDVDEVFCLNTLPVIDDINKSQGKGSLLMGRDDDTYPGYVKLQLARNWKPLTINDWENCTLFHLCDTDNIGRICFKHYYSQVDANLERHGPADTYAARYGFRSVDQVYAFRCKTIPYFATEWLYRRRPHSWPSRYDLQAMSRSGCFCVGVGHCTSREFAIEWRLSFSLQERFLMFNFTPTQHKCYILLKMLKKEIIQQRIGESISSYHCKTCMFFAIENTEANLWKPHKLLTCVRLCLMILLTWVYNRQCPNFFIPSENMFENPRHRDKKNRLELVLRELVSDFPSFILYIQCECIGQNIRYPIAHSQFFGSDVRYGRYLTLVGSMCEFLRSINRFCFGIKDPFCALLLVSYQLKLLHNTRHFIDHTEQQYSDAMSYAMPVLHLLFAQRLGAFAFTPEGQPYIETILQYSLYHFQEGRSFDLFTARILIVTLLMRLKKYDLCGIILEDIEYSLKSHVISRCRCYMKRHVPIKKLLKLFRDANIPHKTFCESCVVTCVTFLPCDKQITPIPLRMEMFRSENIIQGYSDNEDNGWFDWAVVDGKVYLYFLQYLVYSSLNRQAKKHVAIVNLVVVLNCDPNLCHKETGYNLLGWIYIQEGRYHDAVRCLQTSWKIRPHFNAAKFHIRNVPLDLD